MFYMFENPRRGRQARNFTTNVSKILDLKSSSEQIFFRKLSLGAPEKNVALFDLKHGLTPLEKCDFWDFEEFCFFTQTKFFFFLEHY